MGAPLTLEQEEHDAQPHEADRERLHGAPLQMQHLQPARLRVLLGGPPREQPDQPLDHLLDPLGNE